MKVEFSKRPGHHISTVLSLFFLDVYRKEYIGNNITKEKEKKL